MMLMSHLQESIHLADLSTQILYNRAISQIGICAFRCGMLKESFVVLNDLMSTMRVKELLAQVIISITSRLSCLLLFPSM